MRGLIFLFILLLLVRSAKCQEFEWAKSLEGQGMSNLQNLTEGASKCFGLVVDEDHYVYITGICNDSVDFDPGPDTSFVVAGQNDIYIAKYTPSGNLVWKNVLVSQSMNHVKSIKLDYAGNLIILGSIQGDVDFDPSPGSALVQVPAGVANKMIIAKYDPNGNFMWVKAIGGQFATWGSDLETNDNGEIYITGTFYDSLDFDPSMAEYNLTSTGLALFFSKYSENGNLLWVRHIPNCTNLGEATDIDLSEDGDIFISGYFGNTLDFDVGPGNYLLVANTTSDRYFAKYTNNGDFVWANRIDVNNNISTSSRSIQLAVDKQENVFLTGDFKFNVDFDSGPGVFPLTCTTGYATYICKYDSNGGFLWAKMITDGFCVAFDISLDCEENLNLTGVFSQADFDPGTGSYILQSTVPSAFMNFFAQYDSDGNFLWARPIGNNGYGSGVIKSGIYVKNGYQYVFGAFKQSGDFDPDENEEYWLTMGGVGWNSYFAKYSGNWKDNFTEMTICYDQNVILTTNTNGNSFIWQNGSTDSIYTASDSGLFWVSQTKGYCSKVDTFMVVVDECGSSLILMPNVFTPNNDGQNDMFLPVEMHNIHNYSLVIFNRWGNIVFESKNKNVGWTGESGSKNCAEGTYFWVVHYRNHENIKQTIYGFLSLMR